MPQNGDYRTSRETASQTNLPAKYHHSLKAIA